MPREGVDVGLHTLPPARPPSELLPRDIRLAPAARMPARVAVLIPCYNEAATIASVVADFRAALPSAIVYVYDNDSSDGTLGLARDAGAVIGVERRRGKGQVVRRMFADIDADCYLIVDGDGTYDPAAAAAACAMITEEALDFVNVARISSSQDAFRPGHRLGNRVLTGMVRTFFGREITDMLSGYKALSRRFVKSFPAVSGGFETETELTVHALELRMPMGEISAPYVERPSGSVSKLRTYRDGSRILLLIARLIKDERPMRFFGIVGLATALLGVLLGLPVVLTYFETGLVPRLPTAVLSVGLIVLGWLSVFAGLILDGITTTRHEFKRLAYLAIGCGGAG